VRLSRNAFLVLLVYVTLDLSLPAMPGAFVFDPSASVESAQMNRGRAAGDVVLRPARPPLSPPPAPARIHAPQGPRPVARANPESVHEDARRPRALAALTDAATSEEPQ
jgi:hypothetical protein